MTLANAATLVGLAATLLGFWKWWREELRHSDVHAWALAAIRALQTTELRFRDSSTPYGTPVPELSALAVETSVLIEQGRLYFRNVKGIGPLENYGADKPPAYRGIRPKVLDHLVRSFEALEAWQVGTHSREDLLEAVIHSRGCFVSLMQSEVGRSRTRDRKVVEMGTGSPLANFLRDQGH